MTTQIDSIKLARLIEREEIFDLVRMERFYRDQRDFARMIACYVPKAPVRTTWFDGTVEEFAEASRRKMSGQGASAAKHWIFPTALQLNGARGLIESPAAIFDRLTFDGVEFDSFQYCRFVSRLLRTEAGWRLGSFEGIYQRDHLRSVNPAEPLPVDWAVIATLRPSYKFLAYTQLRRGYNVDPELFGDDRPDLLAAFYAREQAWLAGGA